MASSKHKSYATKYSASSIASLPAEQKRKFLSSLTPEQLTALKYDWLFWARQAQHIPAGEWETWFIMTGRGWGKTKTGAETVRQWVDEGARRIALVGPTLADVRQTMITGETTGPEDGLLNYFPPNQRPVWIPSKRLLRYHTGAISIIYSSEEPERLRGPQNDKAWCDEIRAWKYPELCWDNLQMGLRTAEHPQVVVTSTPKPTKFIRDLLKEPGTIITTGNTYENEANLTKKFLAKMHRKYDGTALGQQEIEGRLLDSIEGALWVQTIIDKWRVQEAPQMSRLVVAVDPATTNTEKSDACGLAAAGRAWDTHRYLLRSKAIRGRPHKWAQIAVDWYHELQADAIVAEVNQGGLMVEEIIHNIDPTVNVEMVHATRGKRVRAEPISQEYEQGLWHHVGRHDQAEEEMTTWTPEDKTSPNVMDALVWAGHSLRGTTTEFGVEVM